MVGPCPAPEILTKELPPLTGSPGAATEEPRGNVSMLLTDATAVVLAVTGSDCHRRGTKKSPLASNTVMLAADTVGIEPPLPGLPEA